MLVGIDSGLLGGVSFYDGKKLLPYRMPIIKIPYKDKTRNIIDCSSLSDLLIKYKPDMAVLEIVHARTMQGVTSMFRQGQGYGMIQGVVLSLGIELIEVRSQEWKKYFDLLKKDKDASREKAMELFPDNKDQFKLKKDDGVAEAALIAYYGFKEKI